MWPVTARPWRRLARLGRFRTAALAALGSLSLAAAARTDQSGAELCSWLLSWALLVFALAYLVLLLGAALAPPDAATAPPASPDPRRPAAPRPARRESGRPNGARRGPTYVGST
jgi:heme A synthase